VLVVFVTWKQGRAVIHDLSQSRHERLETFVARLTDEWPKRAPGTSVYLAATLTAVPAALASSLYRYQTLRETVVILKIEKQDLPRVDEQHRAAIHSLGRGVWQATLHYGFMDHPHVAGDLRHHMSHCPDVDLHNLTFFVGRSMFIPGSHRMRPAWRKRLFLWLANSVEEDFDYSSIPSEQLVQIGAQVEV